jgi:hypothetical protein
MAILATDLDAGAAKELHNRADERAWRAYHHIAAKPHAFQHVGQKSDLLELCGQPVHLPIAGNQGLRTRHFPPPPNTAFD